MRLILTLLLLTLTAAAWAEEWVKFFVTDAGDNIYYDPATIKKNGNLGRVWVIQDLKQRFKHGELSRHGLEEYDCKEEQRRFLSVSEHSERMAGGVVLTSELGSGTWLYIAPETPAAVLLKLVCK